MYPLKTGKMSVHFPVKAVNSLYHIIAFHHIIESNQNDIKYVLFNDIWHAYIAKFVIFDLFWHNYASLPTRRNY